MSHDPYAALRFRDYRRLLGGSVLGSVGAEMLAIAVGWELYERTGSKAALGYVGLAQFLPVLLLSLPAGQAADQLSRQRLLAGAQSLMAIAALGLAALSLLEGPIPLVYVCLLLVGVGRAFSAPSRWALVSQIVPASVLGNAVTWNSSGFQLAHVAGPALGGLVIYLFGHAGGALLLTAACALTCAGLVATLRPAPVERPPEPRSLATFLAGALFVWRTKPILATITLDLFAVLLGGATALLPVFARDILEVGPDGLGWLRAAPSLGALVTAILIAHRPPFRRPGRAMAVAVIGFGAATILFGLSHDFWLSFAALALTGALDNVSVVVRGTLVQTLTPDAMRGRVSAVNSVFIGSSNELGAFESGITAEWFGPVASVVGGGIGTILVVLSVMGAWPELLRLGALHPASKVDVLPEEAAVEEERSEPV